MHSRAFLLLYAVRMYVCVHDVEPLPAGSVPLISHLAVFGFPRHSQGCVSFGILHIPIK